MINSLTGTRKNNQWTVTIVAKSDSLTDTIKDFTHLLDPTPDKALVSPDKAPTKPDNAPITESNFIYEPRHGVKLNVQAIIDCLKKCRLSLDYHGGRPIRRDILNKLLNIATDAMQGINYEAEKDAYATANDAPGSDDLLI